jgi:hypothetical protein
MIIVNQTNNTITIGATSYPVNNLKIFGAVSPGGIGSFTVTAEKQGNSFPNVNQLVNELGVDSEAVIVTDGNVQNAYTISSAELSPAGDVVQLNLYRQLPPQQNTRGK